MVGVVVNHNVPGAPRNYVHRVGRTARAGRAGLAITMVSPYDKGVFCLIKSFLFSEKEFIFSMPSLSLIFLKLSKKKIRKFWEPIFTLIRKNTPAIDTERVAAIEKMVDSRMSEFELEEEKIIKILTQVQVMKREAEMQLERQNFGEKRKINRAKKGEHGKKRRKEKN